jgi:hypothetical protein
MDIIDRAIALHGAKKVYEAAISRMGGNRQALNDCGLGANTIGDANEIMTRAFAKLSAAEKASDWWDLPK